MIREGCKVPLFLCLNIGSEIPFMTANTPRSRKAKGAKFQKEIRQMILESFPELEEDDVKTAIMGEAGMDIKLSPAAQKLFPYAVEAKATEKVSLRAFWEQAVANSTDVLQPILITKQSRREPLVVLTAEQFFNLIKEKTE